MASDVSESQATTIIAVVACLLGITTMLVIGRVYSRWTIVKNVGMDDKTIVVAWVGKWLPQSNMNIRLLQFAKLRFSPSRQGLM